MKIIVDCRVSGTNKNVKGLLTVAKRISKQWPRLRTELGELEIVIINDRDIKKINKAFRGLSESTDVLSFDYGQIFISYDTAKRQAKQLKHSIQQELAILLTHGLLHVLGFDHDKPKDRLKMLKAEKKVLKSKGLIARADNIL